MDQGRRATYPRGSDIKYDYLTDHNTNNDNVNQAKSIVTIPEANLQSLDSSLWRTTLLASLQSVAE